MLRSGAARSLSRSVLGRGQSVKRASILNSPSLLQPGVQMRVFSFQRSKTLAIALHKPATTALRTYVTKTNTALQKDFKPHPEAVSGSSTVRPILESANQHEDDGGDMMAGIRSDMETIRETFSLKDVPKDAMVLGLAGVVPYLATAASTVYLSWDINHAAHTGTSFLLDAQTAETLLHIIEPIQIGYGAVIISFLGAIHWGLEWANYGGNFGYSRYKVGVIAPAIAWPSVLMPIEYALITQFLAFNYLYFQDSRAATRGSAPPWYGMYRFVLTFLVGASLVATLISRGQIVDMQGHPTTAADKLRDLASQRYLYLAKEEEEKESRAAEGGDEQGEEEAEE